MIYANKFGYRTTTRTIETVSDVDKEETVENVLVGFIQVEKEDEKDMKYVETKLVKNLKWAARKNNTQKIILHSFAHLSGSKASLEFTKELLDNAEERIDKTDYEASQTPFGYFLDLDIQAPGESLARIFEDINAK
jgi:hypothetical protein